MIHEQLRSFRGRTQRQVYRLWHAGYIAAELIIRELLPDRLIMGTSVPDSAHKMRRNMSGTA